MKTQTVVKNINGVAISYKKTNNGLVRHCEDGPAVIDSEGKHYWYANDVLYTDSLLFCVGVGMNNEESMIFVLKHGHQLTEVYDAVY